MTAPMRKTSMDPGLEARRPAADRGTDGLDLFSVATEPTVPAWAETWSSLTDDARRLRRDRWKELLLPVVRELAARTAPPGVTASEVIAAGIDRGILVGERLFLSKYPRIYSWVGGWLAVLARRGELAAKTYHVEGHGTIHLKRDADRKISHSNDGFIYVSGTHG